MRVFKSHNKNGSWTYKADIWHEGKKLGRFSSGSRNKREAQEAAERHREALIAAARTERTASASLAIGDVGARYMLDVGDAHSGSDNTDRLVTLLVDYFKPEKELTDITHDDALALRRWRREHKVGKTGRAISAYTVNDTIEQLKKLFTYCKGSGTTFPNEPKWSRKHQPSLWLDEPTEHVRELSEPESDRLEAAVDGCRPDYRPLIDFIRTVAKRKMACVNLEWDQVDWDRGVIELKDKGKAGGKPVMIPITATVRAILWPLRGHHPTRVFTYVADRTIDKVLHHKRKDGTVVETRYCFVKGERYPITRDGFRGVWETIRKHAKLTKRFRVHDFRHDFASKALRKVKGAQGIKVVSQALDHADIAITLRTYAHLLGDEVADVMEELASERRKDGEAATPLKAVK